MKEVYCRSDTDIESIVNDPDWIDLDGLEETKLTTKLEEILTDIIKAKATPKIGIIIDLDMSSVKDRITFLNSICSKAFNIAIDIERENDAIYHLYRNFFEFRNDKYVFKGNEEQLYDFLSKEINKFKETFKEDREVV